MSKSKNLQKKSNSIQEQRVTLESWSGPIPPPQTLSHYNELIPNGADRLLTLAEEQSKHRQKLESKVVESDIKKSNLGQWFAFIIIMSCIIIGSFLIYSNKSVSGLTTILVPVLGGVGIFIYGKRAQNKSLNQKKEEE